MTRLDELDQIPLDRKSYRFGIFDTKEYSIDGRLLEQLLELTAAGAAGNRRLEAQLHKLGIKEDSHEEKDGC
tara:strand:- start:117 stop:332 length:216 start_codon:yes stop_codon:yes gene_type:complete